MANVGINRAFIIILIMSNFCTPILITVCPANDHQQKLAKVSTDIIYNANQSVHSETSAMSWNSVIILHSGNYNNEILTALNLLSNRGIQIELVDLSRIGTGLLSCSNSKITKSVVVVNFSNITLQGLCQSDDCNIYHESLDQALSIFISKYPNVLWIEKIQDHTKSQHECCAILRVYGTVDDTNHKSHRPFFDVESAAMSLKNKVLRIGTLQAETGPFVVANSINGSILWSGILFEILHEIAKRYQFRYEIITSPDGVIGVIDNNGMSNGVVGLAQRKEVDIAAYDISITEGRKRIIDFSPPFYFHSSSIMILAPEARVQLRLWNWTSPLGWKIWICLLAVLIVVTSMIYYGHIHESWAHPKLGNFVDCITYVGAGIFNQGLELSPGTWWAQILLTSWWMLCVVCIASYGSFLVATLTAPIPQQLPFKDLKGLSALVQKGEYRICLPGGNAFYDELKASNVQAYCIISKFLDRHPQYVANNSRECIEMMRREKKVAYIDRTSTLEQYQKMMCDGQKYLILNDRLYMRPVSFGFPKNSPYTAVFAEIISEIIEKGLIVLWYKNYSRPSEKCSVTELDDLDVIRASTKRLNLDDLGGVFILNAIGLVISLVVLALEHWKRRNKQDPVYVIAKKR